MSWGILFPMKLSDEEKTNIVNRIQSNIVRNKKTSCWLWQKSRFPNGYGQVQFRHRPYGIHVLAYAAFKGDVPEFNRFDLNSLCVLHSCDVPHCCNPDHLWLGTRTENIRDRDQKGRQNAGTAFSGHNHSEASKKAIRRSMIAARKKKFWSSKPSIKT